MSARRRARLMTASVFISEPFLAAWRAAVPVHKRGIAVGTPKWTLSVAEVVRETVDATTIVFDPAQFRH
jgi:hypothetical protein